MECTHRKLCAGFADGLSRDDTDGFADVDGFVVGKVGAVAVCADAVV